MTRYLPLILLLFSLPLAHSQNQTYALLVGVGDYPNSSGWVKLSAKNDLQLLKSCLQDHKVNQRNISTLLDAQVTRNSIISAINTKLLEKVKPGDIAYFHFSGHGQQMPDKNGDEPDGLDEALVPFNSPKYYQKGINEGQYLLTDDDLSIAFNKLRKKLGPNGRLIITLDACHSGSATRGIIKARGTDIIMSENQLISRNSNTDLIIDNQDLLYNNSELAPEIIFNSSSPHQLSYEYSDDTNKSFGLFTYAFCKSLSQMSVEDNYKDLHYLIWAFIDSQTRIQTPSAEGRLQEKIFDKRISIKPNDYIITRKENQDLLTISGGSIHGLTLGSKVNLFDLKNPKKIIGTGYIDQLLATESDIQLDQPLKSKWLPTWRIGIKELNIQDLILNVKIKNLDAPTLKLLREKLSKNPLIHLKDSSAQIIIEADLNKPHQINLLDADETFIESYSISKESSIDQIIDQINYKLIAINKANRFKKIETRSNELKSTIELLVEDSLGNYYFDSSFTLKEQQFAKLKISNQGSEGCYYRVFEIQPNYLINSIIPDINLDNNASEFFIQKGEAIVTDAFEVSKPYGANVLKFICSRQPLYFNQIRGNNQTSNTNVQSLLNFLNPVNNVLRGAPTPPTSTEAHIETLVYRIIQ